ncbi:RNA polymerase sigma factor, sigma-70 family [Desulfitobacterium dichloroeliminans LMG P-21439]|uniref:RNA polymerase sigma factor, sigma-70 family n=1 Tax=Desulfitobacterium dichloroeliminans (strain LMG P-21439 / DCA1) TaxID=871963 RepID=L0F8X2_DESDL|nr:RNA polymerase sigma factor [Desulfitobacterium dichloroeliminans]AGA69403.1 RNA polymerase sigma factor, sigma-70 family [Desulfitobacterium dichloroeliminans LMG P-21439]
MQTDSFDAIYEELFPVLYRFVRMRVPQSDVEDVTAEVLTKVWRALPNFEGKSSLKSWTLRIAYHHIADFYRTRKGKGMQIVSLSEEIKSTAATEDHSNDLLTVLSVSDTLSKLSEPQVAVIQLRLVEGFSAIEVAQILGITQQAVDSLLYRAKKSFRKYYEMENAGGVR